MEKIENTINQRIKELRQNRGISESELAEKIHVKSDEINEWENNNKNIEISKLIELATALDVSLDYLLTGKEKESQIVIVSKTEYACKNDDPSLINFDVLKDLNRLDESGKNLIDYLEMYDCPKVYKEVVNKFVLNSSQSYSRLNNKERWVKLMIKYDDTIALKQENFFPKGIERSFGQASRRYEKDINIFNKPFFSKNISLFLKKKKILSEILTLHENNMVNSTVDWQYVYANLLLHALNNDDEKLSKKIANLIIELNNKSKIDSINFQNSNNTKVNNYKTLYSYRDVPSITTKLYSSTPCEYYFSLVNVPKSTIKLMFDKGYVDEAIALNSFNQMSDGEIEAEKMKIAGQSNPQEIFITSCLKYGIVSIQKLLKCDDISIIEYALDHYPISFKEMLDKYLEKKDYRGLYKFAIDNDFTGIALELVRLKNGDIDGIKKAINLAANQVYLEGNKFDVNRSYFVNTNNSGLSNYRMMRNPAPRLTSEQVKNNVLAELKMEEDRAAALEGLDLQYFISLLESNNIELLIIKLCVRLEAMLKYDFRYSGTFEEMLNKYIEKYCCEDDGWGYMVESRSAYLLHKLRKYRNGIVHPEQAKEQLSNSELKELINYICKLEK